MQPLPQPFYKMSGAGNDFIVLVEPDELPSEESIQRWCSRRKSLGADGLFVLQREASPAGEPGRVRMIHWNADGSRAELCGNGSRCAARLSFDLGWASDDLHLVTDAGILLAQAQMSGRIRITVPVAASSARPISLRLPTGAPDWLPAEGWFLTVGVPHLVLLLDARHCTSLAALDLTSCAPQLRRLDALGEPGANVNFLLQQKNEAFALRTWERGVEGETLACGSGAVASALVAVQSGVAAWPVEIEVRSGDRLEIGNEWAAAAASLTRADSATRDPGARTREPCFWQEGPATVVARGELLPPGLPPSSSSPARSHGGAC